MTDQPASRPLPQVRVPAHLLHALNAVPDVNVPAPTSLWRLEFDGIVSVAYVHSVDHDVATVVPVGLDPDMADAATLIIDGDASPLHVATTIWLSCMRTVPVFVFDRWLGDVPQHRDDIDEILRWMNDPRGLPATKLRTGPPIYNDLDPRLGYRAELEEPLVDLASIVMFTERTSTPPSDDLGNLLRAADITPSTVRDTMGWSTERARAAFRGTLMVTPNEARRLADRFHLDADVILNAVQIAPPRLVIALHSRQWRPEVQAWADQHDIPVTSARAHVAEQVVVSSRRSAGDIESEPPWHDLIADFFRAA